MRDIPFYRSRLLVLLKTLKNNHREILEFEKFVKSTFFNPRKDVIELFMYIKQFWNVLTLPAPDEEASLLEYYAKQEKVLDKTTIFFQLYPAESEYIQWKINQCIAKLTSLLEDFMVIQEVKNSKERKLKVLTEALKNRGIDKHYFDRTEKLKKMFSAKEKKEPALDAQFYHDYFWLTEHIYFHPNFLQQDREKSDPLLIKMSETLDLNFAIKKLQYACEVYARKLGGAFDFSPLLVEEIKHMINTEYADKPVPMAYAGILDLFETKDVASIPQLKQQIFDLVAHSNINCKLDILIKFFNALPVFDKRLDLYFEIYQFALEKGILIEHGYIAHSNFNNIVNIAISLNKIEWIKDFVYQNSQYLKLDKKEDTSNIIRLYHAYLSFSQGFYDETYHCLLELKIKDVTYGLRYHALLLRTIFEGRGEIRFKYDFDTKCNSFKTYLINNGRNGKITLRAKKGWFKFIGLIKKLYYWQFKPRNKAKLYSDLNAHYTPHEHWLKCKLDQLGEN